MFRQGFGKIGFFLLVLVTLVVSFTNTWKFIVDFLPPDPPWLRLMAFVFFEGGLILWAQYFKHDSENIYRTIIAGLMTFVSLLAVLSATAYEVAIDVGSLGFVLPPAIAHWIPVSILLVMLGQTLAIVLHHFADDTFFARMRHLNQTGRHQPARVVPSTLVSVQQTDEMPAIAAPLQETTPQLGERLTFRQKAANWLGGYSVAPVSQQIAAPQGGQTPTTGTDIPGEAASPLAEAPQDS